MHKLLVIFCTALIFLTSCSANRFFVVNPYKLEKLELGMNKADFLKIMGNQYNISKKERQQNDVLEVLSYRNYPYEDEFYLFTFKNDTLEKWDREIISYGERLPQGKSGKNNTDNSRTTAN